MVFELVRAAAVLASERAVRVDDVAELPALRALYQLDLLGPLGEVACAVEVEEGVMGEVLDVGLVLIGECKRYACGLS